MLVTYWVLYHRGKSNRLTDPETGEYRCRPKGPTLLTPSLPPPNN